MDTTTVEAPATMIPIPRGTFDLDALHPGRPACHYHVLEPRPNAPGFGNVVGICGRPEVAGDCRYCGEPMCAEHWRADGACLRCGGVLDLAVQQSRCHRDAARAARG